MNCHLMMSLDKESLDKVSLDKVSLDKVSLDKVSLDKVSLDKVSADPSSKSSWEVNLLKSSSFQVGVAAESQHEIDWKSLFLHFSSPDLPGPLSHSFSGLPDGLFSYQKSKFGYIL
jgi:hypothetical protein